MQTSPPRGGKSGELDPAPSTAWSRANPTESAKKRNYGFNDRVETYSLLDARSQSNIGRKMLKFFRGLT